MKKVGIIWAMLLVVLMGCSVDSIPEPEKCSMCDDLPRHALCIINLSTGEKLELDIYEPHPFLVGEIAEEQSGGYFRLIRGAGTVIVPPQTPSHSITTSLVGSKNSKCCI